MFFVIILFKLLKKMTPLKSYTISNFVQIFSYHMLVLFEPLLKKKDTGLNTFTASPFYI